MGGALSWVRCLCGSRRTYLDFRMTSSGEPRFPENFHTPQQHIDPRIPLQQPVEQATAATDNLTRQQHEFLEELLELHREQRASVFTARLE